jgi:hypothetical protein
VQSKVNEAHEGVAVYEHGWDPLLIKSFNWVLVEVLDRVTAMKEAKQRSPNSTTQMKRPMRRKGLEDYDSFFLFSVLRIVW